MTERLQIQQRKRLGLMTLAVATTALVAVAAPRAAIAQDYDDQAAPAYSADQGAPTEVGILQRMSATEVRIDRALDDGVLTRFQAGRQLSELANIRTQAGELKQRDGELTLTDLQFIDSRLDRLDGMIQYAENDLRW